MLGGRLITATWNNTDNTKINRTKITRKKNEIGHFKRQTSRILHKKTWTLLKKGNHNRETKLVLIKTYYIKARIHKTQQNCKFCGGGDETFNYMISERSKLTQKDYQTRQDWVSKMIPWELCKNLNLTVRVVYTQPVLENETHKLLSDFEIKTGRLISARQPDLMIVIKKEKEHIKL